MANNNKKPGMTSRERLAQQKAKNELRRIQQSVINRQKMDIKKISAQIPRLRSNQASAFQQQSGDLKAQIKYLQGQKREVDRFGRLQDQALAKVQAAARKDRISRMDSARVAFRKAEHIGALQAQVGALQRELGQDKPAPKKSASARLAAAMRQRRQNRAAGKQVSAAKKKGKRRWGVVKKTTTRRRRR